MMIDHTDIQNHKRWWSRKLADRAVASFAKRHIRAQYVETRQEALAGILELIPHGASVGWGDSVTLHQVGIIDALREKNEHTIFDPFDRNADGSLKAKGTARLKVMREAMAADVFLSGVNAVTVDGKLVSTDATGNRVAPVIFGPQKVVLVVGVNKIVGNLDEAFKRIKEMAAPINSKRHLDKHKDPRFADLPCVKRGTCMDCLQPERICCYTVIIEAEREPATVTDYVPRIHLFIVGEELGI